MLYELITITRPKRPQEAKQITRLLCTTILSQRGTIRAIANWGQYLLSAPIRKSLERHVYGHHVVMRFDASPATQAAVQRMLKVDPRVLRVGCVRVGDGRITSGLGDGDGEGGAGAGAAGIVWSRRARTRFI